MYTNYWNKPTDVKALPEAFLKEVEQIVKTTSVPLVAEYDNPKSKPEITAEVVRFNGVGDDGHETFFIGAENLKIDGRKIFEFCKTSRKPYDEVVKAVLISAAKHGVIRPDWSFDGDKSEDEYKTGLALYDRAMAAMTAGGK